MPLFRRPSKIDWDGMAFDRGYKDRYHMIADMYFGEFMPMEVIERRLGLGYNTLKYNMHKWWGKSLLRPKGFKREV